jgi:hypothetical protein
MTKQLSVRQQNQHTRSQIVRWATWFADSPPSLIWLRDLLSERGISPKEGILAHYFDVPAQGGVLCKGIWLSSSRRFWQFEVFVPRNPAAAISVECFKNISQSVPVSAHTAGIGKSFGLLAVEVLEAGYDG